VDQVAVCGRFAGTRQSPDVRAASIPRRGHCGREIARIAAWANDITARRVRGEEVTHGELLDYQRANETIAERDPSPKADEALADASAQSPGWRAALLPVQPAAAQRVRRRAAGSSNRLRSVLFPPPVKGDIVGIWHFVFGNLQEQSVMATVVIRVDMPPKGELEVSGQGTSPTDEQMKEESQIRQEFLEHVSPQLAALIERPPARAGNVSRVQLLGTDVWSQMNHYVLLVEVDIGEPQIDLDALAPGAQTGVIGSYSQLQQWPERTPEGAIEEALRGAGYQVTGTWTRVPGVYAILAEGPGGRALDIRMSDKQP